MRIPFRLAVIACAVFAGSIHAADVAPSAQAQIQSVMAQMHQAVAAHDTDRFMTGYLHEPSLVFAIDGKVIHGWDALHAQQLIWWRKGKSDVVYTPQGKTEFMLLAPDVAITTEALKSHRTQPDGKVSDGTLVVTSVWKKLAQGWRIVYAHESWVRPPS